MNERFKSFSIEADFDENTKDQWNVDVARLKKLMLLTSPEDVDEIRSVIDDLLALRFLNKVLTQEQILLFKLNMNTLLVDVYASRLKGVLQSLAAPVDRPTTSE